MAREFSAGHGERKSFGPGACQLLKSAAGAAGAAAASRARVSKSDGKCILKQNSELCNVCERTASFETATCLPIYLRGATALVAWCNSHVPETEAPRIDSVACGLSIHLDLWQSKSIWDLPANSESSYDFGQ